jgi:universal stress protein A
MADLAKLEAEARKKLGEVAKSLRAQKLSVETAWTRGTPFLEIIRYARENSIDLIVMGTHGRGFMAHLLLGSVAENVVRQGPCPVLTVRKGQHVFERP